ncbi:hypothetical protein L6164_001177 [Bauhinia variegata]|uniref:Uncharacterized protein n=1 Tax=Bauhinia variegata TaxID=167791 RepID=A0ACB9QAV6_BAUVA|nr:hypothetical protein L6164_001177 [Bauhinia variegata]
MIEAGRIEGNTAETETNLMQKTPSCITAEENNNGFMKPNMRPEKRKVQVLPFYFVNIWQKDVTFITRIKDAIKLFEEGEQYHFEISDKIKRKKLDRDRQISKLNDLNKDYQRLKGDVSMRRASLQDKYKALEEICFLDKADRGRSIKSSSNKKQLKEHTRQLKFQILHGCKTLAEERRALQEKKLLDQWGAASVSPLQGISSPTLSNKLHGEIQNLPRWKKNPIANVTIMPKTWTPLKQSIRNEAEIICDELMEMRRKKKELENNIKIVEKELESTNTKLWSFRIDDLKHEQDMKDASLCIELEEIMACQRGYGVIEVLPKFFYVDPLEVWYQRGTFGEAFENLMNKSSISAITVMGWRNALAEAANLSGFHFSNYR